MRGVVIELTHDAMAGPARRPRVEQMRSAIFFEAIAVMYH